MTLVNLPTQLCWRANIHILWMLVLVVLCSSSVRGAEYAFNLEAGPALKTLKQLAIQAEIQLVYSDGAVRGVETPSLRGHYAPEEALSLILVNTPLIAVQANGNGSYVILRQNGDQPGQGNQKTKTENPEQNMKIKNKGQQTLLRSVLSFALASLTSYWVSAQNDDEEDILYLSPFVVQTDTDAGYLVGSTLGATRTNVALKDLPFQINVITSELLDDTAAYDVDYAVAYLPGVSPVFNEFVPQYNIRGFNSSAAMRNGVRSWNKPDASQIQRIEAVKGPAALLYGQTEPGGVINYITKQPQFESAHSARVQVGNYGLFRSTVSSTGAIGGGERIAYRIDAAFHEQGKYDSFQEIDRISISPMFLFRITEKTDVLVSYNLQEENLVPSGGLPLKPGGFRGDPENVWVTELGFNHSKDSPYSSRDIDSTNFEVQLRHNFFEGLDLRVNFAQLQRDRGSIREGGTGLLGGTYEPGVTGLRRTVFIGDIQEAERVNLQADLAYIFETGPVNHQIVLGYERNEEDEYRQGRWFAGSPEMFGFTVEDWPELAIRGRDGFIRFIYDVFDPVSEARRNEFARRFMPKSVFDLPVRPGNTAQDDFTTSALFANWQLTWNDDRGRILLGGRFDDIEHIQRRFANEGNPILGTVIATDNLTSFEEGDVSHFSPQAGISYAVTDAWTVYALYSKSVNPRFEINPARNANAEQDLIDAAEEFGVSIPDIDSLPWDQLYDPETGRGMEVGIRYAPIDNSKGFTVAFYDIEKQDIVRPSSNLALSSVGFGELSGTETSVGVDVDFFLNLLNGKFQVIGGYTYADTEQASERPGLPVIWAAKNLGNVWGNYKFDNGFSAGLGMTFIDDRLEEDNSRISPGYSRTDAQISYRTTLGKFPTRVSLNIRNLFDTEYRIQRDQFGVPLEWILSVGIEL